MEKIKISHDLRKKLDGLVSILYEKNYFSFKEQAKKYVAEIYDFIVTIPTRKHRICKDPIYGRYHCSFKPNKRTSWYVTFDIENEVYLVRNIFNNHTGEYPEFIGNLE